LLSGKYARWASWYLWLDETGTIAIRNPAQFGRFISLNTVRDVQVNKFTVYLLFGQLSLGRMTFRLRSVWA
jgi:hypothetical protein